MRATIVGTGGDDRLSGTSGDDVIVGGGGLDVIDGGPGDDVICGGPSPVEEIEGNDAYQRLAGGAGDDVIVGGDARESIDGEDGADLLIGGGGADFMGGQAGNDALHGGAGDDWLHGDQGTDRLYGGDGGDFLEDFAGANVVDGGAGDDVLDSGPGNETIRGGGGRDTVSYADLLSEDTESSHCNPIHVDLRAGTGHGTGFGTDTLTAVERVRTGGGDDVLVGDGGPNAFYTGFPYACDRSPRETVDGGGGMDRITFDSTTEGSGSSPGPVRVYLPQQRAVMRNQRGLPAIVVTLRSIEAVTGTEYSDVILGDNRPNSLSGGPFLDDGDLIKGRGGADRLFGQRGPDRLFGGAGSDVLLRSQRRGPARRRPRSQPQPRRRRHRHLPPPPRRLARLELRAVASPSVTSLSPA